MRKIIYVEECRIQKNRQEITFIKPAELVNNNNFIISRADKVEQLENENGSTLFSNSIFQITYVTFPHVDSLLVLTQLARHCVKRTAVSRVELLSLMPTSP